MIDFSVLRPWMLLFALPAFLFCLFRIRSVKAWFSVVDPKLLPALLVRVGVRFKGAAGFLWMFLIALCVVAALAGVSVRMQKTPLYEPKNPVIIMMDMSLSMRVNDTPPNRFSRAVFKTYDILKSLKGTPVGLIVFTDEPYLIVPPTTDKAVIESVLPLLNFGLMPSQGTRLDRAVTEALTAVKNTGASYGDLFLLTDGGEENLELQDKTVDLIKNTKNRLFVLGIGTKAGAVLTEKDKPVLDRIGNPVVHRLKEGYLKSLAVAGGGAYTSVTTDASDVDFLIKTYRRQFVESKKSDLEDAETTADEGYWFLIPPLLAFPFLFRQKYFLALYVFVWATGAEAFEVKPAFMNPETRAAYYFDAGRMEDAVQTALKSRRFTAIYNIGTRLIHVGNYGQAIELLEKAVALRPQDENAQINLEIAKRLNESPPSDGDGQGNGNNPDKSGGEDGSSDGNSGAGDDTTQQNKDNPNTDESPENGNDGEDRNRSGNDGKSNAQSPSSSSGAGQSGASANNAVDTDAENEKSDDKDITIVPDDPSVLLKHKIKFIYEEKRYGEEPKVGAPW